MKDGFYETRKEQIEADAKLVDRGKMNLRDALKGAAMVGACEERDRTLGFLRGKPELNWLYQMICDKGVLDVLGYKSDDAKTGVKPQKGGHE